MLFSGWNEISAKLIDKITIEKRALFTTKLDNLGKRISQEWAKDNKVSKISSSKLQKWGNRLKSASKNDGAAIERTILEIEQEVDVILS